MNIEQAIDILKNSIADYVIGEYCEKCSDNKKIKVIRKM